MSDGALTELEVEILEIMRSEGLVGEDRLAEVQEIRAKMAGLGLKRDLCEVLVQREFVSASDAERLRKTARYRLQREEDDRFARLAASSDLLDQEVLDDALAVGEGLFNARGDVVSISDVLIQKSQLSADECAWIRAVLSSRDGRPRPAEASPPGGSAEEAASEAPPAARPARGAGILTLSPQGVEALRDGAAADPAPIVDERPTREPTPGDARVELPPGKLPKKQKTSSAPVEPPPSKLQKVMSVRPAPAASRDDAPGSGPASVEAPAPRNDAARAGADAPAPPPAKPDESPPPAAPPVARADADTPPPSKLAGTADVPADTPPPSRRAEGAAPEAPPPSRLAGGPPADTADEAPPARRRRSVDVDDAGAADGVPAAEPRRRRRLFTRQRVIGVGLALTAAAAVVGLQLLSGYLADQEVEEAYQAALRQVRQQDYKKAEVAFRAFLKDHPDGTRGAEALRQLQELLHNKGDAQERLGLAAEAIAAYREIRLLDPDTDWARKASQRLTELTRKQAAAERTTAWAAWLAAVKTRVDARAYREALDQLARPPFETLTAAEAQQRQALQTAVQSKLSSAVLERYTFRPASRLRLPKGPPAGGPDPSPRPVRRYALREAGPQRAATAPGGAVFAQAGRQLMALSAADGRVLWARDLGRGPYPAPVRVPSRSGIDTGSPALPATALVVDPGRRSVSLLEAATGKVRWERHLGSPISCRPGVSGAHVMVGVRSGWLYLLRLDDGAPVGAFRVGGEVLAPPTHEPASDLLLIPSGDGFIYIYKLEPRTFVTRVAAPAHPGVSPLVLHSHLFVPRRAGEDTELAVVALNASGGPTGKPVATFSLAGRLRGPGLVAGGRVICVSDRGVLGIYAVDPEADTPVYPLTRDASGRNVLLRGPVQAVLRELDRQLLLVGDDVQQFQLPEPSREAGTTFDVPLAWRYEQPGQTGGAIHGELAGPVEVVGGTALFTTRDGVGEGVHVHAFDLGSRQIVWHRTLASPAVGGLLQLTEAQVSDGRLVSLTADGRLHSISLHDGERIYRRMRGPGAQLEGGGAAAAPGGALIVARGQRLERLDAVTAEPDPAFAPDFRLKTPVSCGPRVINELAWIGTTGGGLYAIDARSGRADVGLFTSQARKPFSTDPLAVGARVVVGCLDHTLYALEIKTTGRLRHLVAAWSVQTGGEIHARPVLAGRTLYAASDDGTLYSIDPDSGQVTRRMALTAAIRSPLAAAGGKLALVTQDRRLHLVDPVAGKVVWSDRLRGLVSVAPRFEAGTLYVATTSGRLIAYDVAAGKRRWTLELPDRFRSGQLQIVGKRLYAVSHTGFLYEVDLQ